MPSQNQPIEPSAFRELQRRVEQLEAENHRDAGRKLVTIDRLTTANLPAPSEGQLAVEHADDKFKYYANGQWREAGSTSTLPWIRIYYNVASTITATPGTSQQIPFDQSITTDAGIYFDAYDAPFLTGLQARVLETGYYLLSWRLWWNSVPDGNFSVDLNGVDWDDFLYYEQTYHGPTLTGYCSYGSYPFRSGPGYQNTPPEFWLQMRNPAANSTNLVLAASSTRRGSYMEIVRLGDATPDTS